MRFAPAHRGFSLMETLVSLVIILVLLAILLPSLASARVNSRRETCRSNQRQLFAAFGAYLKDHDGQFPGIAANPAWFWGGVRFDAAGRAAAMDDDRPINAYLPWPPSDPRCLHVCRCPADCGITDPRSGAGTGSRTAYRAYGTSYRANALLFDASRDPTIHAPPEAPVRGLRLSEVSTPHSRLLILGDPIWFEVAQSTGRDADWHAAPRTGNFTFLDGSVRFLEAYPKSVQKGIVYDPRMPGSFAPVPAEGAAMSPAAGE